MDAFLAALERIRPPDEAARAAATAHHGRLTKPPGSLGALEALGAQLAAIAGHCPPPRPRPAAVALFAGDHGVVAQGVTPWPQEVTAQMVATIAAGRAAISVLARAAGASVTVVDVGVATPLPDGPGMEGVRRRRVRAGTADLALRPAMTDDEVDAALAVGAEVAADLVAGGARCLVMGEMGIGNTTPSAALVAGLCGVAPAAATGRGTGIDDERLARKVGVVEAALARAGDLGGDPRRALAEVGGLEIAALAGFAVGGAASGAPVVVDGVISLAALLVASRFSPHVVPRCIAGHRSTEPAATVVLQALGMRPLLELDLRLGEGTGACLALGPIEAAAAVLSEMATFDDAGIEN
jgi:nicotinate-nucleotide--dimethylbenzimidazole phosphoribosyltransferase